MEIFSSLAHFDSPENKKCFSIVKTRHFTDYLEKIVNTNDVESYIADGWEKTNKHYKSGIKFRRKKSGSEILENRVWRLLYSIGYQHLNCDRKFEIAYPIPASDGTNNKQIDVFGVNDDTILVVECKAATNCNNAKMRPYSDKGEIDAFGLAKENIIKAIRKDSLLKGKKIKFIFVTENYYLGEAQTKRLSSFRIVHWSETQLDYFEKLCKNLGESAKYQICGTIFNGERNTPDILLPAIQGTLGGHRYYMFSVEPQLLLKYGFIAHRIDSNRDSMPTYQRLIKKDRLKKIKNFINSGGYFPNSILVNIETKENDLQFQLAANQKDISSLSRVGIVQIPARYKSIYIIDGQHRVYSYAGSNFENSNSIPVVAFINLMKDEQIKLFMQINENQKAVPKNLRNTLEEDLKLSSLDFQEQRDGLRARIARELGETQNSPLYKNIVIGENSISDTCSLTLQCIIDGLKYNNFLSVYKNNKLEKVGLFDRGDIILTEKELYEFLELSFRHIKEQIGTDDWNKRVFLKPDIFHALCRIFNDLIRFFIHNDPNLIPISSSLAYSLCGYYNVITDYWKSLSLEERGKLIVRGGQGPVLYWRNFQKILHLQLPNFEPEGLVSWINSTDKDRIANCQKIVREVEEALLADIKNQLIMYYGGNEKDAISMGLPSHVYSEANTLMTQKNYGQPSSLQVSVWECLNLIHYKKIIQNKPVKDILLPKYAWPHDAKSNDEKVKWLDRINIVRNAVSHVGAKVSDEDYDYLLSVSNWLLHLT